MAPAVEARAGRRGARLVGEDVGQPDCQARQQRRLRCVAGFGKELLHRTEAGVATPVDPYDVDLRPSTRAASAAGNPSTSRSSRVSRWAGRYSHRNTIPDSAVQTTKTSASTATSSRWASQDSPVQMPSSSDTA